MLVYFDESYPDNRSVMILGALFLSNHAATVLRENFLKLKRTEKYSSELKYSEMTSNNDYILSKLAFDTFFNMQMPYFCATILPYSSTGLTDAEGSSLYEKRVNVYSDSAKKLVRCNLPVDERANLFMDQEERIEKTKFASKIKKMNPHYGARVVSAEFVKSHDEAQCLMQICDLLTGSIKQWISPTFGKKSKYKRKFALYVMRKLKITSCSKPIKSKIMSSGGKSKFALAYWRVPAISEKQKNRS